MALGVDQWAAEVAVGLGIPFIAAVPFQGQEAAWPTSSQERYAALLKKADEVVIVSEGGYSAYKMQVRNELCFVCQSKGQGHNQDKPNKIVLTTER